MSSVNKEVSVESHMKSKDIALPKESLDTLISGDTNREIIDRATASFLEGLAQFLSPAELLKSKGLAPLYELRRVAKERVRSVQPLVVEIIASINERAKTINSSEYKDLVLAEAHQWRAENEPELEHGVRACVDAGIPREAVAGSEGHMGRTLAGDDDLDFVPSKGKFVLAPSSFRKRLIHEARMGTRAMLEIFVEHTGCGRRGQMLANLDNDSEVSRLYSLVFDNIMALLPEFAEREVEVSKALELMRDSWGKGYMKSDGGIWAGILVKIAQRQAYRNIGHGLTPVVQIQLYDKMNGNEIVGLDNIAALTHPQVMREGGFTANALEALVKDELIFSLKHEIEKPELMELLTAEMPVQKGENTFQDLQKHWIDVKKKFVAVSGKMWEMYHAKDDKYAPIRKIVDRFLILSLLPVSRELDNVDRGSSRDGIGSELMKKRLTHQLFRAFAYAWVLDTFTRGNPPGHHMEDHLASGESAVLGVKEHLPLGQADLQPPSVSEFLTGRTVLMHSKPGQEGLPVVAVMKHDTAQPDNESLTTEETQRAMDDFEELLKLWPYIVVGDLVPVIAIRDKRHGGVSRLALSIILSFGDVLELEARKGRLKEFVPASNSKGEVVYVPASLILKAGVQAQSDLRLFRKSIEKIADDYSEANVQALLHAKA